ncbi:hypothetical protein [Chitinophaga sp. MM2321]|uniref:hypothetical protein n=1 Tax=Chitinophaga sp. MM2321 TaxID=3137178 RepID=UPI0032D5A90B
MSHYNILFFDKLVLGPHLYQIELSDEGLKDMETNKHFLAYSEMGVNQGFLKFVYDSENRCIYQGRYRQEEGQAHLQVITLPAEVARLRHKIDLKTYDQINADSAVNHYGFQKLGEMYAERILGMKPQLMVASDRFYLDTLGQQICSVVSNAKFPLSLLTEIEEDGHKKLECLYDETRKLFLPINSPWKDRIGATCTITFDELKAMDPVGVAELEGRNGFHYLNRYPLNNQIRAQITKYDLGQQEKLGKENGLDPDQGKGKANKSLKHKT